MRALVSSGRSVLLNSWPTTFASPGSGAAVTDSTGALPPFAGAASNPVARTVIALMESFDWTVANALPA